MDLEHYVAFTIDQEWRMGTLAVMLVHNSMSFAMMPYPNDQWVVYVRNEEAPIKLVRQYQAMPEES